MSGRVSYVTEAMSSQRVLFVNAYAPPFAPGGAEHSMMAQARAFIALGYSITLITPDWGSPPKGDVGVHVSTIQAPTPLKGVQSVDESGWIASPAFLEEMTVQIRREWSHGTPVHLHGVHVLPLASHLKQLGIGPILFTIRDTALLCPSGVCLMESRSKVPRACTSLSEYLRCRLRYVELAEEGRKLPLWRLLRSVWRHRGDWYRVVQLRRELDSVDGLIGVSEQFSRIVSENLGRVVTPVYNIPPVQGRVASVEELHTLRNRLGIDERRRIVLLVGKRSIGKGTLHLYRAAQALALKRDDFCIVSVGKGVSLGNTSYWREVASVPADELMLFYQLARLVVIPSLWPEPFSRVILESLVAGVPLLVSSAGGSPEGVRHEVSGWVYERGDDAALVQTLGRALDASAERLGMMREEGRKLLSERFASDRSISRLIRCYNDALPDSAEAPLERDAVPNA